MKVIPLLPLFDLYAGTYDQQGLLMKIRTTYSKDKAEHVINALGVHMLPIKSAKVESIGSDSVLERLRSNNYDVDLILDLHAQLAGNLSGRDHGYDSCWVGEEYILAFKRRYPPIDGSGLEKYYDPAPNIKDHLQVIKSEELKDYNHPAAKPLPSEAMEKLRAAVDAELGEGALFNMLPWLNPENDRLAIRKWVDNKVKSELAECSVPRKDLRDVDRLDGHYASWLDTFVSHHLANVLPHFKTDSITARMLEAITGVSHRVRWLSERLTAYERVFGCEDLSLEELQGRKRHPVSEDGVGNRSKAQFDEPDEPSLFKEGETEELNPSWVLYTTNYHRGLLTQEQVMHVGNNLLKQIQQCSPERLQELGPRGIPNVLTKFGHVSMAWVMYFKNAHQPDLNFGQITRLGHTVAEQVKAYKPRG